jgi:hypothetical protein
VLNEIRSDTKDSSKLYLHKIYCAVYCPFFRTNSSGECTFYMLYHLIFIWETWHGCYSPFAGTTESFTVPSNFQILTNLIPVCLEFQPHMLQNMLHSCSFMEW